MSGCGQMLTYSDVFNARFVIHSSQQRYAINTLPLQINLFIGKLRFNVGGFSACHCICTTSAHHTNTQPHESTHHMHTSYLCVH